MATVSRSLAVVTGASSGIGYELAKVAAENDFDLIIAADEAEIEDAAINLRGFGCRVQAVETDLSTILGVDKLLETVSTDGRPVSALMANAGRGLGHAFLDQNFEQVCKVVDTNITGTIYLIHRVGQKMRDQNSGRILNTGSIAGFMPGSFQAVYNGSNAFLNSFSFALRNELKDSELPSPA